MNFPGPMQPDGKAQVHTAPPEVGVGTSDSCLETESTQAVSLSSRRTAQPPSPAIHVVSAAGEAVSVEPCSAHSPGRVARPYAITPPCEPLRSMAERSSHTAFTLDSEGRVSPWDEGQAVFGHVPPAPITCQWPCRAYGYAGVYALAAWALALWVWFA